ncbi:MAG TPA: FGGY family carbohydrate kinase [Gammaproteobacteria bacterium]|nr:FGGY family carbohydrate kinase [Gammaproteobacteria bacterium]
MASGPPLVLTLDQGGHGSRALIFDAGGNVLAMGEAPLRTQRPTANRVEHAPLPLLKSLRTAAEVAVGQLPRQSGEITTAALATQRSTIVCWDRWSGRALSPVISWQDRRAARHVKALASHADGVKQKTGLPLSPHYGASKIAWCLEHIPAVRLALRERRLVAGPLASFILANLLEERPLLADPVNGSRTLLQDLETGRWSQQLCALFGIPMDILPPCVPNRYAFGRLHVDGRAIPLKVVTGDQPAALFALGEPRSDTAYINIGTGAFVQCLGRTPAEGLLQSVVWRDAMGTRRVLEATVNGAGSALSQIGVRLHLSGTALVAEAEHSLQAAREPPLFLNGVGGLGAPYWQPRFRSRFLGRGTAGAKLAAVVESVAFLITVNLERMRAGGAPLQRLAVSGGLARLDGLCQRLADLNELPAARPELHEATALGLAWLAGMDKTPTPALTSFEPRTDVALHARYGRWRTALEAELARAQETGPRAGP